MWSQNTRFYAFLSLSFFFHLILVSLLPSLTILDLSSPIWVDLVEVKEEKWKASEVQLLKGLVSQGASIGGDFHLLSGKNFRIEGKASLHLKGSLKVSIKHAPKRDAKVEKTGELNRSGDNREIGHKGSAVGGNSPHFKEMDSSDLHQAVMPPQLLRLSEPVYPLIARKMGYEGCVLLEIEVLIDGSVGDVRVIESSGYEVLDKAAVTEAKKWRFVPAKINGNPIKCVVRKKVEFKLK